MSKFDKIAVLNKIGSTGMVPVFYHKDAEVAKKVVKACYDGGVRGGIAAALFMISDIYLKKLTPCNLHEHASE